jgi:hypothetical protein
MGKHAASRHVRWYQGRRAKTVGVIAVLVGGSLIGVAGAAPGGSADVTFIPLFPPKKILSASIASHTIKSPVVIGGSTTVPSDATSVALTITIKSANGGLLSVYPAGNSGSTSEDIIPFDGGNAVNTVHSTQNVGTKNEITLANNGTATATVTVTITGYSTQLTAAGISGTGGSQGDVLTNNGAGGTSWQKAGQLYVARSDFVVLATNSHVSTFMSVNVPAGLYFVSAFGEASSNSQTGTAAVTCELILPNGNFTSFTSVVTPPVFDNATFQLQAAVQIDIAGTLSVQCHAAPGPLMSVDAGEIDALPIGTVVGPVWH